MVPTPDMLPELEGPNAPHWQGANAGQVVVQACRDCGRLRFPHSPVCPACAGTESQWTPVGHTGRILSWCRFHKAYFAGLQPQLPYTVLLVALDDGVLLYTNPVDEEPDAIPEIGARVRAVFVPVSPQVTAIRFART